MKKILPSVGIFNYPNLLVIVSSINVLVEDTLMLEDQNGYRRHELNHRFGNGGEQKPRP